MVWTQEVVLKLALETLPEVSMQLTSTFPATLTSTDLTANPAGWVSGGERF